MKKTKVFSKRAFALFVALMMCVSMTVQPVFAEGTDASEANQEIVSADITDNSSNDNAQPEQTVEPAADAVNGSSSESSEITDSQQADDPAADESGVQPPANDEPTEEPGQDTDSVPSAAEEQPSEDSAVIPENTEPAESTEPVVNRPEVPAVNVTVPDTVPQEVEEVINTVAAVIPGIEINIVPEIVQSFLNAVAKIPGSITADNAAEAAELIYGEVSEAYEALLGTEYEEREDVQAAVTIYAAAVNAVDAALEMENEVLASGYTPVANVTINPDKKPTGQTATGGIRQSGQSLTMLVGQKASFLLGAPTNKLVGGTCGHTIAVYNPSDYCDISLIDNSGNGLVGNPTYAAGNNNGVRVFDTIFEALKPGTSSDVRVCYYANFGIVFTNPNLTSAYVSCPTCGRSTLVYKDVKWYRYNDVFEITVNADYCLNYDINGGSWDGNEPNKETKSIAAESCNLNITEAEPKREGYNFVGWAEKNNPGENDKIYKAGDSITLNWSEGFGSTENPVTKTLYAIWEKNDDIVNTGTTYKVVREYYINDEKVATVTGASKDGKVGDEIKGEELANDNPNWKNYTVDGEKYEFDYAGCNPDPSLTLEKDISNNIITLRYECEISSSTEYTVTYKWTGLPEGHNKTLPTEPNHKAGETVTVDNTYPAGKEIIIGDKTYVFSGWSTSDAKISEDNEFTMPEKDVIIKGTWEEKTGTSGGPGGNEDNEKKISYTVVHKYYKNNEEIGEVIDPSNEGKVGDEIKSENIEKKLTYAGLVDGIVTIISGFDYTSADPESITLAENSDNTIILRYDLTENNESEYKVTYTWSGLPSEATETLPTEPNHKAGDTVAVDTDYFAGKEIIIGEGDNDKTYVFSGWSTSDAEISEGNEFSMPEKDVVISGIWTEKPGTPGGPGNSEEKKISYTVIHEYYTNGVKDEGDIRAVVNDVDADTVISAVDIAKINNYNGNDYTYTSASPDSITLAEGSENIIILRYDRTTDLSYKVEWYSVASGSNGDVITALRDAEMRTAAKAGEVVSAADADKVISGYRYINYANGPDGHGTIESEVLKDDGSTVLKLYFRVNSGSPSSGGSDPTPTPDRPSTPSTNIPDGDTPTTDVPSEEQPDINIPDEDTPLANIPDEEPPLADLPDEEPPLANIPDEDTPLSDISDEDTPLLDIPDEEVPLDDVPQTGDNSVTALWAVLCLLALLVMAGCAVAPIVRKCRK